MSTSIERQAIKRQMSEKKIFEAAEKYARKEKTVHVNFDYLIKVLNISRPAISYYVTVKDIQAYLFKALTNNAG
jgi:hypothetical protein